ncbi:hypothetical protein G6F57_012349 [Rhizopus arrhizus]|nr:hypothetical protein G6F57_012349 [Rhizopus arrhizus]
MELAQQRRDPGDADRIGNGEAQPAARAGLQLAHRTLGFFKLARDALAMLVVDRTGFGQAEAARGPVQQARAQARFQFLHFAADRGLGKAERFGSGNEAALLDHLDEDQRLVEIVGHGRGAWTAGMGQS